MGTVSTFGTFTMARLGIYVAQQALTVTGNNITNINTEGYTRQTLDQANLSFGGADRYQSRTTSRLSGGVIANGVTQLRDPYLDIRYRNEMTSVGQMDAKVKGLNEIAGIFDEVGGGLDGEGVLEARFNELLEQMERLNTENAGKDDIDTIVRSSASALVRTMNDYAKRLDELEESTATGFEQNVDYVNTILTRIRDLSSAIRKTQVYGGEALTQEDERNNLIDELSEYIGIDVTYETETLAEGVEVDRLVIKTKSDEPKTLIDGVYGSQLSIRQDGSYGLDISELKNSKGIVDLRVKTPEVVDRIDVVAGADVFDFDAWTSTIPTYQLVTESEFTAAGGYDPEALAEANRVADMLNADPTYYEDASDPTKAYYYEVRTWSVPGSTENHYAITIERYETSPADTLAERMANADRSENVFVDAALAAKTRLNDTELTGSLQAQRELLTESGEYTVADKLDENNLNYDATAATKRGIPYYQKALDLLASTFAMTMNKANTMQDSDIFVTDPTNGDLVDSNGTAITVTTDASGNKTYSGRPALREGYEDYVTIDSATDSDGNTTYSVSVNSGYEKYFGGPLFSNSGSGTDTEDITARNISIAKTWADGTVRILQSKEAEYLSRDNSNIRHMITLMTSDQEFVMNPNEPPIFKGTFQEMFTNNIAGVLADDTNVTETMLGNHETTADDLYVERDGIMGVDLNDEAMNLMQFQKAYSAACRLMTTFDSMLERLIDGTAT